MVKRSIEQEIRNKNFGARSGNFEKNAVVKNQGTTQRVQRILGDCWQWETNGQCVKGDNCSFRHDINKRGKVTPSNPSPNSFMQQNERKSSRTRSPRGKSPSGRTSRWPCKDFLRGTCNNSFCEKWHPPECLFYNTKSGCRFGEKCSYAHRQVDEQPTKRSKKNVDKVRTSQMFLFFLAVSRPDSNCHERDGRCTDDTSLDAHTHTFSQLPMSHFHSCALRMVQRCDASSSQIRSFIGHVVVWCSFDTILSDDFFIFHFTCNTSDLSTGIRLNPCASPFGDGVSGRLVGPIVEALQSSSKLPSHRKRSHRCPDTKDHICGKKKLTKLW